ncbi:hypothetical protein CY652_16025 [Burkholderia sp. WAC0059]|nr:hypothetical protein CY652_16025 [Burkholderia sp. WAC0059]
MGWLAVAVGIDVDLAGLRQSEAALAEARHRLDEARQSLQALPELRREAAIRQQGGATEHIGSTADDMRYISRLAAGSGVELVSLEPDAAADGDTVSRSLKLVARGDFARLLAFLQGLRALPALVVPADAVVKRDASVLSLSATLKVFDTLRPPIAPESGTTKADDDVSPADPFDLHANGLPGGGSLRLAGVIADRTRGVALVETPAGTATVMPGQLLAGGRVTRIGLPGVTLMRGGALRALALGEGGQ